MKNIYNVEDFRKRAEEELPGYAYGYYAAGTGEEITLRWNLEIYKQLQLKPRVLTDVSNIHVETTILKQSLSLPILIAPSAHQKMAHSEGEIGMAKAAHHMNTIMTLAMYANTALEDVVKVHPKGMWLQMFIFKNRKATLKLIRRAEEAGYQGLVITVDHPISGIKEYLLSSHFQLPTALGLQNLLTNVIGEDGKPDPTLVIDPDLSKAFDASLTWQDIEWAKANSKLPIILKGILHEEDAKNALNAGVDAIILSNHGGRQLDTAISPLQTLPQIAGIINNKMPLLIDSGIRRGSDIFKAIALGADAVLIGRAALWGLTVDGSAGVKKVLEILRDELITTMALCGFPSLDEVKKKGKEVLIFNHEYSRGQ